MTGFGSQAWHSNQLYADKELLEGSGGEIYRLLPHCRSRSQIMVSRSCRMPARTVPVAQSMSETMKGGTCRQALPVSVALLSL